MTTLTRKKEDLTAEIVDFIQRGTEAAEYKAYTLITQSCYEPTKRRLWSKGLTNAYDIEEVLQETITAIFVNVRNRQFKGESKISTYFSTIAFHKWIKILKNRKKTAASSQKSTTQILSLADEATAFLDKKLSASAQANFKERLKLEPDLQEIVAAIKASRMTAKPWLVYEDAIDTQPNGQQQKESDEVFEELVVLFPPDSECPQRLFDYYFVYDANYQKMAYAIKRKVEDVETVYSRVKKQVNRCLNAVKEKLKK